MLNHYNRSSQECRRIRLGKIPRYSELAYANAVRFLNRLNACEWTLPKKTCVELKDRALSGDIEGAERELYRLICKKHQEGKQ